MSTTYPQGTRVAVNTQPGSVERAARFDDDRTVVLLDSGARAWVRPPELELLEYAEGAYVHIGAGSKWWQVLYATRNDYGLVSAYVLEAASGTRPGRMVHRTIEARRVTA